MKNAWFVSCALLFVSIAGFAETPSKPSLSSEDLAAILGQPAVTRSCATRQSGVVFASEDLGGGSGAEAYCE
ncbi:MAG TPA: hypothetical protein VKM72_02855 [Thermoanaerobaculia bacterium]|nr:hypothetical protein [Thermoanaerobaculia bacterium]